MASLNIFLIVLSLLTTERAQDHTTVRGVVKDSKTEELLAGASVRISGTTLGTQSKMIPQDTEEA